MGDKLCEVQWKELDLFNVPKRRDKKKLDTTGCLRLSNNKMSNEGK